MIKTIKLPGINPHGSHDKLVNEVFLICKSLGYETYKEYKGRGWIADVFVVKGDKKIAIEVQLTRQSPKVLWKRQNLYLKDKIEGCWLILNPYKELKEHINLPIFYISSKDPVRISLIDNRKEVNLQEFLEAFLGGGIKFCHKAKTHDSQRIKIIFYTMNCWKCGAVNHLYYVDKCYSSSCNFEIDEMGALWSGGNFEFKPEIINAVREYLKTEEGKDIHIGKIRERFSKTVQNKYKSFGCYKCDSIFGDFFVFEAEIDLMYEPPERFFETIVYPKKATTLKLPHWCFPDDKNFCE